MTTRRPQLELDIPSRSELEQRVVGAIVQREPRNRLRVAAIEAFSHTQDCRQRANRLAPAPAELAKAFMTAFGSGLSMVAGDERDRLDLVGLETVQIAVLDQIVRVLVVAFIADVYADVVQQRGVFQPLALPIRQTVDRARLVEERHGQARDLL